MVLLGCLQTAQKGKRFCLDEGGFYKLVILEEFSLFFFLETLFPQPVNLDKVSFA